MPTEDALRSIPAYELDRPMKAILIGPDELSARVRELGRNVSDTYRGSVPLLISVLKGGVVFLTDLMRAITIPHHIDFLQVSSYAGGTKSTGTVRIMSDLGINIAGRDVLVVEDIVDTGLTLTYLLKQFEIRQPRSLKVCALLSKPSARQVDVTVDFLGFEIPNEFVVGYGLDYEEKYRNLPYIGILDSDRRSPQTRRAAAKSPSKGRNKMSEEPRGIEPHAAPAAQDRTCRSRHAAVPDVRWRSGSCCS